MLQLNDSAGIKVRAIKADIPPDQTTLSTDELELKSAAQHMAQHEADEFQAFLDIKHAELNDLALRALSLIYEQSKKAI